MIARLNEIQKWSSRWSEARRDGLRSRVVAPGERGCKAAGWSVRLLSTNKHKNHERLYRTLNLFISEKLKSLR